MAEDQAGNALSIPAAPDAAAPNAAAAPDAAASKIVRTHALAAVAAGLVPIPFVGIGILGAVHLRMLSQLAKHYKVTFSEQRANSIIGSLVGISATTTAASFLRMVPGIGQVLSMVGALTLPSASTYALGEVFIKHFESGGTFLTFDPERAKPDYKKQLAEKTQDSEQSYVGIKP
jgi:uncharacterized protein (DUF697 family)